MTDPHFFPRSISRRQAGGDGKVTEFGGLAIPMTEHYAPGFGRKKKVLGLADSCEIDAAVLEEMLVY